MLLALGLAPLAAVTGLPQGVPDARADEARSTAVVFVEPADAADDVARALGPDVRVLPSKKLADVLVKRGLKGKLHATLGEPARKQALADALRRADLGADQIVVVSIRPTKGGASEVRALSITPAGGASRGDGALVLAATDDRVAGLRKVLGVERAARPSTTAPATAPPDAPAAPATSGPPRSPGSPPAGDDEAAPKDPQTSPPAETPDVTRALVSGFAGLELTARRLTYTDALSSNVRPYSITGAPSPAVGVELYPLARTTVPVLRDLGIVASGATAAFLSSKVPGGAHVSTRFLRYQLGLRYRIRVDDGAHPIAFGIEAGLAAIQFRVSDVSALAGADPSVDDRYLRFGLDARVPVGPVALLARAGIGRLVAVGPMGAQFPRGRGGIFDARLGLAAPLGALVEGRLWVEHTRAFFDFRPLPGDPYVAGGAVDSYSTVHLDALVHF